AENTELKRIIKEIGNLRIENAKLKQIIKGNQTTNDNAPNSEKKRPIRTDPKSTEDKKIDDSPDLIGKESVSNMMEERNRDKKIQREMVIQDSSKSSSETILSKNDQDTHLSAPKERLSESCLIQELTSNFPEIDTNNGEIEISKSCIQDMVPGSTQCLSDLFDKAIKLGQKQILCWYNYSFEFENKVKSLTTDSKWENNASSL
ncbi:3744_t:CDS:2, partial [Entrophospora sp. SA101]